MSHAGSKGIVGREYSGFRERLEAVWRRIDRDELVRFAQDLIRIPSVSARKIQTATRPESPATSQIISAEKVSKSVRRRSLRDDRTCG